MDYYEEESNMNPLIAEEAARQHIAELAEAAGHARLVREARGSSSLRSKVGHGLVSLGESLIGSSPRPAVRR